MFTFSDIVNHFITNNREVQNENSVKCKLIIDYDLNICYIPKTIMICSIIPEYKRDIEKFLWNSSLTGSCIKIINVVSGHGTRVSYQDKNKYIEPGMRGFIFEYDSSCDDENES